MSVQKAVLAPIRGLVISHCKAVVVEAQELRKVACACGTVLPTTACIFLKIHEAFRSEEQTDRPKAVRMSETLHMT